jgi:hypothetical protein
MAWAIGFCFNLVIAVVNPNFTQRTFAFSAKLDSLSVRLGKQ